MSRFGLLVTHAPFDSPDAWSAYQFASAALKLGHSIDGIFFYSTGTLNANRFITPFSDETNLHQKWCELHAKYRTPLLSCVSSANRRGILSAEDAAENDDNQYNLAPPFAQVGLGEFFQLCHQCDRIVQF
jgi:tRNA 2-thiouridine synthesizing protein D